MTQFISYPKGDKNVTSWGIEENQTKEILLKLKISMKRVSVLISRAELWEGVGLGN